MDRHISTTNEYSQQLTGSAVNVKKRRHQWTDSAGDVKRRHYRPAFVSAILIALLLFTLLPRSVYPASSLEVVVSEIAWMGTTTSYTDEWIELYNNTGSAIDLTGWTLSAADGTPTIVLSGSIPAGGYFLLERTNDDSVPGVVADQIYTGDLGNDGEDLTLTDDGANVIDSIDCSAGWFAGHNDAKVPMTRVDLTSSGNTPSNWTHNPRCGTATNAADDSHTCTLTTTSIGSGLDYAVYFNERATTATGTTTDPTPMETVLLSLIDGATSSITVALYGLDRQSVIDALIAAHNRGVAMWVVGDDEAAAGDYAAGYQALIDAGISVVTDTATSKIQHNKFLVIDESVVWTGSTNFTDTGLTLNANNSIVITDTMLAAIYITEFKEMQYGHFHEDKADDTPHLLDYAGTGVESYFSPTDLPAFEVWDELLHADETIHFSMFFWTDDMLAQRAIERIEDGVQVYGVWDQLGAANQYSQDEALCAAGAHIGIEDLPGKVHHKFAVIDVEGADPTVILGSYNWTAAGAYDNDENTLIIHDRDLARAYHAEWQRLWATVDRGNICNPLEVYLPAVLRGYAGPTPIPTNTPVPIPPTNTPSPPPADVQIIGIEYDPPGDDVQGEYVTLHNDGGRTADMTNWTLRDEANHVYTFPTFSLAAGGTVQVWTKSGADTTTDLYWGSGAAIWNNTGDTAYLRDSGGTPIDTYSY